jgi:hypothetical protein
MRLDRLFILLLPVTLIVLAAFFLVALERGIISTPPMYAQTDDSDELGPNAPGVELPEEEGSVWNEDQFPNPIPDHPLAPKDGAIELHLFKTPSGSSKDLVFRLTNVSDKPINLLYGTWPYEHAYFRILDHRGKLVKEVNHLILLSLLRGKPKVLHLEPSETYSEALLIFHLAENQLLAGDYKVKAVFRYRDLEVHSEAINLSYSPLEK